MCIQFVLYVRVFWRDFKEFCLLLLMNMDARRPAWTIWGACPETPHAPSALCNLGENRELALGLWTQSREATTKSRELQVDFTMRTLSIGSRGTWNSDESFFSIASIEFLCYVTFSVALVLVSLSLASLCSSSAFTLLVCIYYNYILCLV